MTVNRLITDTVKQYLPEQSTDGSFPAGHNGPYLDPETPTRNTAHMLFLLARAYEIEMTEAIKGAAERAIDYLFSKNARPHGATFYCRDKEGKDRCNGLVGQAWVMEALIKASQVFNRPDCYQLAEDVFFLHKWEPRVGIWHRTEIDGTKLTFDGTFNHQLWFAAIASQLHKTPLALECAEIFLHKVSANVKLYPDGVIFHSSPMGTVFNYFSFGLRRFLREIKKRILLRKQLSGLYSKSIGYHGFNLYAYAMLKEAFPKDAIWKSNLVKKMMRVVETTEFQTGLIQSKFGYFYNVSGIEIAYAMEVLCLDEVAAQLWLTEQWEHTYEGPSHLLTKGVVDKNTAIARLYELARLKGDYK